MTATEDHHALGVLVHPGLCEGHGLCRRWAPSVYHLDAEGYVDLHRVAVPPELAEAARIGASVCPARAITIIEAVRSLDAQADEDQDDGDPEDASRASSARLRSTPQR